MTSKALNIVFSSILLFLPYAGVQANSQLNDILSSPHRDSMNAARDEFRNPAETLAFFGITANMHVAEIWPGRGWYTEILAPWFKQGGGTLIAAGFPVSMGPEYRHTIRQGYAKMLENMPEQYDEVIISEFGPGYPTFAAANSLDAVLTFRNVHNWAQDDFAQDAFDAFYTALKPGGVLGVIDHRAQPDSTAANNLKSGYLTETYVIELAEAAGFTLKAKSDINANPADNADHPNGVWSLLPNLRVDDADKARYRQIGESDRMTLRFLKPVE